MRGRVLSGALVLLATAGCGSSGSSTCDKVVQGYKDYSSKAAACGVTIPIGSFDSAACQSALNDSGCTEADKQQWGNFGTCLSALPSCTPGNTTAFTNAVVTCTTTLSDNLSPNCG
jgi:hypothetical protein